MSKSGVEQAKAIMMADMIRHKFGVNVSPDEVTVGGRETLANVITSGDDYFVVCILRHSEGGEIAARQSGNNFGTCSKCDREVVFKKYVPANSIKICTECMVKTIKQKKE